MFPEFDDRRIDVGDAEIHLRTAGDGPPVLLLHGFPQTHVAWHEIAPRLAEEYTVVAPDLRGYGDSTGPADPTAADYTHRRMATDMVAVMERLGFEEYDVVGHDRGARIGYRYALDHPERVRSLAVLDIVPTLETAERMDYESAHGRYHWLFLAQPHPIPETLINNDPAFYLEHLLESWAADRDALDPDAVAEYRRCYREESVVRASCEDYRAGLTLDLEHDRTSRRAGETIECPLLVLWGGVRDRDSIDILDVWEPWASSMKGKSLPCGHFLMEEAPEATLRELRSFLER
jgi:haloacetate dehalogenase